MDGDDSGRKVDVVLFNGFELLDVFGPVELLSAAGRFDIELIGPSAGGVVSAQGPEVVATRAHHEAPDPDIVLVPGGVGTRALVGDRRFLDWLSVWAGKAKIVSSVCTGSALLAAAGLLDGYRATSNKRAFSWAVSQGPGVEWMAKARWVEDRDRWTSSGVAAGMDMTVALIARLCGAEVAAGAADRVEYEPHVEWDRDPFGRRVARSTPAGRPTPGSPDRPVGGSVLAGDAVLVPVEGGAVAGLAEVEGRGSGGSGGRAVRVALWATTGPLLQGRRPSRPGGVAAGRPLQTVSYPGSSPARIERPGPCPGASGTGRARLGCVTYAQVDPVPGGCRSADERRPCRLLA